MISYHAIEELAYLLGVKISKDDQRNLVEKYKKKHVDYWRSRHLIQRRLEDFYDDNELLQSEHVGESFRLMPKNPY